MLGLIDLVGGVPREQMRKYMKLGWSQNMFAEQGQDDVVLVPCTLNTDHLTR